MICFQTRGALGATAFLLLAAPAFAHATLETSEARAGASYKAVIRIPHGCDGQATEVLTVSIPDGLLDVKPMPKPGWTLEIRTGALSGSFTVAGKPVTEGVREIVWRGGHLADAHYDEFVFRGRFDASLAGRAVPIPIVQTCASATVSWTDVAAPGQDPHALASPAPVVRIVSGEGSGHGHGAPAGAAAAAPIAVGGAWIPATPAGAKVAGGYAVIANATPEADTLTGGTFDVAGRVEIHEMSDAGGVMRMRELAEGLPVPAGGKAELKPGGLHLMLMDLKRQLKDGETVRGTLRFRKAGDVPVEFRVRPLGSRDAGGGHHHH